MQDDKPTLRVVGPSDGEGDDAGATPEAGPALGELADLESLPSRDLWLLMRRDFVHGEETLQGVAERYGKTPSYVRYRATHEGWGDDRRIYRNHLAEAVTARILEQQADRWAETLARSVLLVNDILEKVQRSFADVEVTDAAGVSRLIQAAGDLVGINARILAPPTRGPGAHSARIVDMQSTDRLLGQLERAHAGALLIRQREQAALTAGTGPDGAQPPAGPPESDTPDARPSPG